MYHRNDELCVFVKEVTNRLGKYLYEKSLELQKQGIESVFRTGDVSTGFTIRCKDGKMHTLHFSGFYGHLELYEAHDGQHTDIQKFDIEDWNDDHFKVELKKMIWEYCDVQMD